MIIRKVLFILVILHHSILLCKNHLLTSERSFTIIDFMMKKPKKLKTLSLKYSRWKKQLVALHQGHLKTVKKLAIEAKKELAMKANNKQLSFSFTS